MIVFIVILIVVILLVLIGIFISTGKLDVTDECDDDNTTDYDFEDEDDY